MAASPDFYQQKARLILAQLPKGRGSRLRRGVLQGIALGTEGVVSEGYLHQMARGHIAHPGADKLLALSQQLQFPADWWSLPVEAGPPPMAEGAQQLIAELMALPPAKCKTAIQRMRAVLAELAAGGLG